MIPEHVAVRTASGVFDVSHMGELHVDGPRATDFLQGVLSNDLDRIGDGSAQYTLLTNDAGRDRRRPDRLPAQRTAASISSSTREHAGRLRLV